MCASNVARGEARNANRSPPFARVSRSPPSSMEKSVLDGAPGNSPKATAGRVYNSNFLVTFVRFFLAPGENFAFIIIALETVAHNYGAPSLLRREGPGHDGM